jgi:hypothetical protein
MPKQQAFNLTTTKMEYWHRHAKHMNDQNCIICRGNMYEIAEYLKTLGLEVLDVGHAWIKIKAEKNYSPFNGGTTDESNLLFRTIANSRQIQEPLVVQDLVCPKCGGMMKVKSGKYGKFLGCSNYPNCRHTMAIDDMQ